MFAPTNDPLRQRRQASFAANGCKPRLALVLSLVALHVCTPGTVVFAKGSAEAASPIGAVNQLEETDRVGNLRMRFEPAHKAGAPPARPEPQPTAPIFIPILQATARPDGAIIHVVQTGQTLIGIANVYGVPVEDLFAFNDLTANSFINPGDEIIVRPPRTPTPTVSPTPTATATPTVTKTPTPTITARPALALAATAESAVTPTATPTQRTAAMLLDTQSTRGRLLLAIVASAFLFLMVPFIASLRRRR